MNKPKKLSIGSDRVLVQYSPSCLLLGFTIAARAIGQFLNYRVALKATDPERQLFLAVPESAYNTFFQKEFPRMVIEQYQLELFVYDIENEVIVLWQV